MTVTAYNPTISEKSIDVVEAGRKPRKGRIGFNLDQNLEFSIEALRSYAFARWETVIYDAMVVSASIEFADLFSQTALARLGTAHHPANPCP